MLFCRCGAEAWPEKIYEEIIKGLFWIKETLSDFEEGFSGFVLDTVLWNNGNYWTMGLDLKDNPGISCEQLRKAQMKTRAGSFVGITASELQRRKRLLLYICVQNFQMFICEDLKQCHQTFLHSSSNPTLHFFCRTVHFVTEATSTLMPLTHSVLTEAALILTFSCRIHHTFSFSLRGRQWKRPDAEELWRCGVVFYRWENIVFWFLKAVFTWIWSPIPSPTEINQSN